MSDYGMLKASPEQEAAWEAAGLTQEQPAWNPPAPSPARPAAQPAGRFEPEDKSQRVTALTSDKADRLFGRLKAEQAPKPVACAKAQSGFAATIKQKLGL
jgi:hypothetical protein